MFLNTAVSLVTTVRIITAAPASVPGFTKRQRFFTEDYKHKTCTDKAITDASLDPQTRWHGVETVAALTAANIAWVDRKNQEGHVELPYAAFISNLFHGPETWNCQDIGDIPCSTIIQCDDTNYPAGYFILNAFSRIHQIHQEVNTALTQALGNMQSQIGTFTSIFTTKFDDDATLIKVLVDVALFSLTVGSAYYWNRVASAIMTNNNARGQYTDSTYASLGFIAAATKDTLPAAKDTLGTQNNLNDAMGTYFSLWRNINSGYVRWLFSGEHMEKDGKPPALRTLWDLLVEGAFNYNNNPPDLSAMQERVEAIVWSQLIVAAWKTNPAEKLHPFILEVGEGCDRDQAFERLPSRMLHRDDVSKTFVCYNNKSYFVARAVTYERRKSCNFCPPEGGKFMQLLPGGTHDELDGTKWNGVKLDDFVASSVDAWAANGRKNGYNLPDATEHAKTLVDSEKTDLSTDVSKLLRTPGLYGIPVCSDIGQVVEHLVGEYGDPTGDWWPCNP